MATLVKLLIFFYNQACGGTVSSLTNALSDLKRDDAINILMSHQPDSHSRYNTDLRCF